MIAVIQRVKEASVSIDGTRTAAIGRGLLVLLGIETADDEEDIDRLSRKIANLRIFNDEQGVMNESLVATGGELLLVSQFTLHADTRKGNRPSYAKAAKSDEAIPLYRRFIRAMEGCLGKSIETGEFGADMQVSLVNDGPVTIIINTKDNKP